jgi:hypothetical protein
MAQYINGRLYRLGQGGYILKLPFDSVRMTGISTFTTAAAVNGI